VLALAVGLGGAEFARAHVLTGFPWNDWGMALGGNVVLAQIAAAVGLHGLTLITIVLFALPAVAFEKTPIFMFAAICSAADAIGVPFIAGAFIGLV
jgi:apolipoprotein N-acyltransferase